MWMYAMLFLANRRERESMCERKHTKLWNVKRWMPLADLFLYSIWRSKLSCMLLDFFWSFVVPILTQTQGAAEPFFSLSSFFMLSHSFLSLIFMTILVISLTVYIFAPCSDWWRCTSNIYCELCKYIKWMHSKYISNHLSITVWFLFFFSLIIEQFLFFLYLSEKKIIF